ncbi:PAS domain S-box protein [Deinococcus sp. HMF7604]|uniref:ATP-binding protein n=1 Tax=Deinococcus betulae TaxID=2873312 RepID=UPI001CC97F05|nr:ATP-binding protein [Deinococcus betulae]MBZ9752870.1 PAS domain S-box protein [Deinococcus betulae]
MNPDPLPPQVGTSVDVPVTLDGRLESLQAQVLHLQASLHQAQGLFQESPGAAFLLTDQSRIQAVNACGAALIGSSQEGLLGRNFAKVLSSSSRTAFAVLLSHVFEGRGRQKGELQLLTLRGEVLEVAVEAALHVREGASPEYHLTLTDVTAFKLAHRALLEVQHVQEAQFHSQTLQLKHLQEEFESVVLLFGQGLEGILTRAQSFLLLARQQPDQSEHLRHTQEGLQQTQSLLNSLKRYMQMRFLRTRLRSVDLNRVFREVLKDVESQRVGRDVLIISTPLPTLSGDSQVLQIILLEYLHNALKFTRTRPETRIRVLVQEDAGEYRIGVEDNGIGFNMRQKDKAFELFGQLHAGGRYEGTGLGLAVVRRLCERFGGRAWGEGKVDQGATFWFAWPKTPAPT